MTHAFRLTRGADLRKSLLVYAQEQGIEAAVPLSCVGCVSSWRIRAADGVTIFEGAERAEIVSLMGTLSCHGVHLHISLAREDLSVIGGHLLEGCLINTTAEVVLMEVAGKCFVRVFDPETGYDELTIEG